MAIVEGVAPSDSVLHRDDSFLKDELVLQGRPSIDTCCNTRCRPGIWVNELPTYVSMSMCYVLFGTKLNWLLLCVPLAIIGAQGVFGHVSPMNTLT
jgi:hypothetical protein